MKTPDPLRFADASWQPVRHLGTGKSAVVWLYETGDRRAAVKFFFDGPDNYIPFDRAVRHEIEAY